MKKIIFCILLLPFFTLKTQAQEIKKLSLQETVKLGLANSKQLNLDSAKINKAVAMLSETKDAALPTVKLSFGFSHAFMLASKFKLPLPGQERPITLPQDNNLYLGTFSFAEPIFTGGKLKNAKASAEILIDVQKYSYQNNQNEVILQLAKAYFNLYEMDKTQHIIQKTISDIKQNINRTKDFKAQGMATKNDVLRWQLQLANARLDSIEITNSRQEINYTLDLLLGLKENTQIQPTDSVFDINSNLTLQAAMDNALKNRMDLQAAKSQSRLADINIKSAKSNELPTLAATSSLYYINPNSQFIPPQYSFIAPFMVGLNLSWDIASLYTTKHKVAVAQVSKQETTTRTAQLTDAIKIQVQKAYLDYKKAKEKVDILKVAVNQSSENKHIYEAKYQNHLASTTDRIDAETQFFKSDIQYELSKAQAQLAYYNLLKATGNLKIEKLK